MNTNPTKLDKAIRYGILGLCAHTSWQFVASAKFYALCKENGFAADELYNRYMSDVKTRRPNLPK